MKPEHTDCKPNETNAIDVTSIIKGLLRLAGSKDLASQAEINIIEAAAARLFSVQELMDQLEPSFGHGHPFDDDVLDYDIDECNTATLTYYGVRRLLAWESGEDCDTGKPFPHHLPDPLHPAMAEVAKEAMERKMERDQLDILSNFDVEGRLEM